MTLLRRKVFRIGVQSLLLDPVVRRYYMEIRNRTYYSVQPVPTNRVHIWFKALA